MEYKASLDTLCRVATTAVIALLIYIGQCSVRGLINARGDMTLIYMHSGIVLFTLLLLVVTYAYSPQSYLISHDELIIKRLVSNKRISLSDITEARLVDDSEMKGTIRTFGVGGLFGYYGKFYNRNIGSMTWYVTQRKNMILICTDNGKKIVISPDDTGMVDKLKGK